MKEIRVINEKEKNKTNSSSFNFYIYQADFLLLNNNSFFISQSYIT